MAQAGYTNLDYKLYFEPEGGINTPREFTDALVSWSNRSWSFWRNPWSLWWMLTGSGMCADWQIR